MELFNDVWADIWQGTGLMQSSSQHHPQESRSQPMWQLEGDQSARCLFTCVLQQRLQRLAEDELAELLCGFWRSCGCTDMIFCVRTSCARQLIEKTLETPFTSHMTAFPHAALWRVLDVGCWVWSSLSARECLLHCVFRDQLHNRKWGVLQVWSTPGMPNSPFNLFFNLVVESCQEAWADTGAWSSIEWMANPLGQGVSRMKQSG